MESSSIPSNPPPTDPPQARAERPPAPGIDHEIIWGTLAFGMFAVASLPASLLNRSSLFFCPFRAMTGLPCPFCGGTHAMQAFVRGEWRLAWGYNPLAVGIGIAAATYLIYAVAAIIAGKRWRPRFENSRRATGAVALAILFATAANWIWLVHLSRSGTWLYGG